MLRRRRGASGASRQRRCRSLILEHDIRDEMTRQHPRCLAERRQRTAKVRAKHRGHHVRQIRSARRIAQHLAPKGRQRAIQLVQMDLHCRDQRLDLDCLRIERQCAVETRPPHFFADERLRLRTQGRIRLRRVPSQAGTQLEELLRRIGRADEVVPPHRLCQRLAFVADAAVRTQPFRVDVWHRAQRQGDVVISRGALGLPGLQREVGKQADPRIGAPFLLHPQEEREVLVVRRQRAD